MSFVVSKEIVNESICAIKNAIKFSLEISSINQTISKEDKSPVSLADIGCQLIIRKHLKNTIPNASWIAEEDMDSFENLKLGTLPKLWNNFLSLLHKYGDISCGDEMNLLSNSTSSPVSWILDPIDGTMGYLRGDQYAICLSLMDNQNKTILFGIIGCPRLSIDKYNSYPCSIFHTINSSNIVHCKIWDLKNDIREYDPCHVNIPVIEELIFCESIPSTGHCKHEIAENIKSKLNITTKTIQIDSQVKYCLVAMGLANVYIRLPSDSSYVEKIWDHAAGMLLVHESGGKVTDLNGMDLVFEQDQFLSHNRGILATCGEPVHSILLSTLGEIKKD